MTELREEIKNALAELKKSKERKFNQTVDLVVNLQKFNVRKNSINLFVNLPYKTKEKKVAGFLESKNGAIDTITKEDFKKYSDKKTMKKMVKKYDFFVAQSNLMPQVATNFGRVLGPAGKMPSPQLGIILNADEKTIRELKEKIDHTVKTRVKEASVKIPIGKQDMDEEKMVENVMAIYNALTKELPKNKDNIKNIELKLTMSKPVKIQIK